jgi:hypothetical protein
MTSYMAAAAAAAAVARPYWRWHTGSGAELKGEANATLARGEYKAAQRTYKRAYYHVDFDELQTFDMQVRPGLAARLAPALRPPRWTLCPPQDSCTRRARRTVRGARGRGRWRERLCAVPPCPPPRARSRTSTR